MNSIAVASWLLTYLIHSTVLLTGAWLASRRLGDRNLALQEILLRAALVGGILTASLQMGLGIEPLAGAFAIDTTPSTQAASFMIEVEDDLAATHVIPTTISTDADTAKGSWSIALLTLWGVGSVVALIGLTRSHGDLRRLLRTRRFRPAGRLIERLASAMGLRRRVRLSTSEAIAVPFATGIKQPEICCPERVGDLAVEHQTGLFAHELAHLARRDPAWQLIYRLGEAFLILQPLNRLVRRRLEEIAEHLTDERAVACTGDRVGLARCLVVVAHWGVSSPIGMPASALAAGPRLDRRVRRLISGSSDRLRITPWAAPFAIAAIIGAVSVLPVVAPAPAHAELTATGSEPVRVRTWSEADDAPPKAPPAPAPPALVAATAPVAPPVPDRAPMAAPGQPTTPALEDAVPPAPAVEPVPEAAPAPPVHAIPPNPATAPDAPAEPEEPDEKKAARERHRQECESTRVKERERSARSARERAEARAEAWSVEYEERARQMALRAAEMAERSELSDEERDELMKRLAEMRVVAEDRALEARARAEARAEAWTIEYQERARKMASRAAEIAAAAAERQQLTEEQREEMMRRIEEMRATAEARALERSQATEERARKAAERARRIAERAEEERIAREEQRRDKDPGDQ